MSGDPLDEVAEKVQDAMTTADNRVAEALADIRELVEQRDTLIPPVGGTIPVATFNAAQDRLAERVPALLAAINKALELTDPLRNPTLGGTFLGAVGVQVREAILAELERPPVGQGGTR